MASDDNPVLLPDKFDGGQRFDEWMSQFECISKINGWNDGEKALWLRARVTREAHVAYNHRPRSVREAVQVTLELESYAQVAQSSEGYKHPCTQLLAMNSLLTNCSA